ncbi:MAG: helicase-related protein [Sphaerochaeta sp.]
MTHLEDIKPGSMVRNLVHHRDVEVLQTKWWGSIALDVTYKDHEGNLGQQILYREQESSLEIIEPGRRWAFDGDGNMFKLLSEAYRIHLAHLFDPYLAVNTSSIEPLPHQITAVYGEMLTRQPLRYLLADDPGAGKTIMTGLLIKELMIRGDVKRCLIVAPGNLVEQWQDELFSKFGIKFNIITNEAIESAVSGNVFSEVNLAIARLDKLSRNDEIQKRLEATDWDLIVCDEAHKMSASMWGGEVKYTKRFKLGRLLSNITRHFLLLTATPHNGKDEDFQLFMSLIDADRFEGIQRTANKAVDVSDVMRRLVKEDLLKFDGKPLFPERLSYTVNYDLSDEEAELYTAVTEYVREEFNRADKLNGERKNTVGFALTILQRRLASSPEAIYQSLKRRREKLEQRIAEEKLNRHPQEKKFSEEDLDDLEDAPDSELEEIEEELLNQSSAASTMEELGKEILTLKRVEAMANSLRASGNDHKWDELSRLLQDSRAMMDSDGNRKKLIIFTEHKDTLRYLTDKVRSLIGRAEAVVNIFGGMGRDERRKIEQLFKQDKDTIILIATDAAGEGINLQRAHLMINYDLPWNPNRLEQRFGRIHRIGQKEVCHLWNLVAKETREGMVFQRLFEKLEEERRALGGKVFDVLGKLTFENKPLRDLLVEAVRYGNQPDVKERLNKAVDNSLDRKVLIELLEERSLTSDTLDVHTVMRIKEEMERLDARRLQPHFIQSFFMDAFPQFGGRISQRESNRFEVPFVPFAIRNRDIPTGIGRTVLKRYERVSFNKENLNIPGKPIADLLCPGHPLLDGLIDLILEQRFDVLKQGAVLIDDSFSFDKPRLLFYLESTIQDGKFLPNNNRRVISQQVHFIEIDTEEKVHNAGYAPYLDYRVPNESEKLKVEELLNGLDFLEDPEALATKYAIEQLIPSHLSEIRIRRLSQVEKIEKAVHARLTSEIRHWDQRANDLRLQEAAGKTGMKLNSARAQARAEEIAARLQKRMDDLQQEKNISPLPPVVIGGAVVIPSCLLEEKKAATLFGLERKAIEQIAMNTVMAIERELGYEPKDVSADNCGYDIESKVSEKAAFDEGCLRFIEVKGRTKGSTTVTVTKNEILTSLNKPDHYILAIVEVDDKKVNATYLKNSFSAIPDSAATSTNFDIALLLKNSEIVFTQQRGK